MIKIYDLELEESLLASLTLLLLKLDFKFENAEKYKDFIYLIYPTIREEIKFNNGIVVGENLLNYLLELKTNYASIEKNIQDASFLFTNLANNPTQFDVVSEFKTFIPNGEILPYKFYFKSTTKFAGQVSCYYGRKATATGEILADTSSYAPTPYYSHATKPEFFRIRFYSSTNDGSGLLKHGIRYYDANGSFIVEQIADISHNATNVAIQFKTAYTTSSDLDVYKIEDKNLRIEENIVSLVSVNEVKIGNKYYASNIVIENNLAETSLVGIDVFTDNYEDIKDEIGWLLLYSGVEFKNKIEFDNITRAFYDYVKFDFEFNGNITITESLKNKIQEFIVYYTDNLVSTHTQYARVNTLSGIMWETPSQKDTILPITTKHTRANYFQCDAWHEFFKLQNYTFKIIFNRRDRFTDIKTQGDVSVTTTKSNCVFRKIIFFIENGTYWTGLKCVNKTGDEEIVVVNTNVSVADFHMEARAIAIAGDYPYAASWQPTYLPNSKVPKYVYTPKTANGTEHPDLGNDIRINKDFTFDATLTNTTPECFNYMFFRDQAYMYITSENRYMAIETVDRTTGEVIKSYGTSLPAPTAEYTHYKLNSVRASGNYIYFKVEYFNNSTSLGITSDEGQCNLNAPFSEISHHLFRIKWVYGKNGGIDNFYISGFIKEKEEFKNFDSAKLVVNDVYTSAGIVFSEDENLPITIKNITDPRINGIGTGATVITEHSTDRQVIKIINITNEFSTFIKVTNDFINEFTSTRKIGISSNSNMDSERNVRHIANINMDTARSLSKLYINSFQTKRMSNFRFSIQATTNRKIAETVIKNITTEREVVEIHIRNHTTIRQKAVEKLNYYSTNRLVAGEIEKTFNTNRKLNINVSKDFATDRLPSEVINCNSEFTTERNLRNNHFKYISTSRRPAVEIGNEFSSNREIIEKHIINNSTIRKITEETVEYFASSRRPYHVYSLNFEFSTERKTGVGIYTRHSTNRNLYVNRIKLYSTKRIANVNNVVIKEFSTERSLKSTHIKYISTARIPTIEINNEFATNRGIVEKHIINNSAVRKIIEETTEYFASSRRPYHVYSLNFEFSTERKTGIVASTRHSTNRNLYVNRIKLYSTKRIVNVNNVVIKEFSTERNIELDNFYVSKTNLITYTKELKKVIESYVQAEVDRRINEILKSRE